MIIKINPIKLKAFHSLINFPNLSLHSKDIDELQTASNLISQQVTQRLFWFMLFALGIRDDTLCCEG